MSSIQTDVYSIIPPYMQENIAQYFDDNSLTIESQSQKNALFQIRTIRNITSKALSTSPSVVLPYKEEAPIEVWDGSKKPKEIFVSRTISNLNKKDNSNKNELVEKCYQHMGDFDLFCQKILQRYAVNNSTKAVKSVLFSDHIAAYNNAFWDPNEECVYFGTYNIFNQLSNNEDVIKHEFGHAITQYSSNLTYCNQSGALNESISDVIAIMAKHFKNNTLAQEATDVDWLIGNETIATGTLVFKDSSNKIVKHYTYDKANGTALRSFKDPGSAYKNHPALGTDPQPKDMRGFELMGDDNGGVHINSSIPNHVFYTVSTKLLEGCWKKAGMIWYNTVLNAKASDDFPTFAFKTLKYAQENYGDGISNVVGQAWQSVGVNPRDTKGHYTLGVAKQEVLTNRS